MQFFHILCVLAVTGLSLSFPVGRSNILSLVPKISILSERATAKPKVNAASVKTAATNFASDANTVSASINKMGDTTDKATVKSLATTAFKAESDEDAQRSVLAAAAGSAGAASNTKIVKNTPAVLDGLSAIMQDPSAANTKSNLASIQKARNPNILPSITQLSNAALDAMGLPANQQKFPATTA